MKEILAKIYIGLLSVLLLSVIYGVFVYESGFLSPYQRGRIRIHIYTYAEKSNSALLKADKRVTKLGPLPIFYNGAQAFPSSKKAFDWIKEHGLENKMAVYQLSGDYLLDTYLCSENVKRTACTLYILKEIPEPKVGSVDLLSAQSESSN